MKTFFSILLISLSLSSYSQTVDKSLKPNIIFILCDDLGYGDIKSMAPKYCAINTPYVDQLSKEGMRFTNAHSGSSVCTPTRYGLLTGRYSWRTRLQSGVVQGYGEPLIKDDRMTVAGFLRDKGYHTAIIGKWHLNFNYLHPKTNEKIQKGGALPIGTTIPDGPITRGFDYYYGFHHARAMENLIENDKVVEKIDVMDMLGLLAKKSTDYIKNKAADAMKGNPFFMYVPLNSPHAPIVPSKKWQGKSGIGVYGDFVMETDWAVGEILKALEQNGIAENTLVLFSSDNGCAKKADFKKLAAYNHYPSAHLRGLKADIWEGGNRVPFIVRWPEKIKAGSSCHQTIGLTDFMATCADILGEKLPDHVSEDGMSFYPALTGKHISKLREGVVHHSSMGRFAIRKGKWKMIFCPGSGSANSIKDVNALQKGLPKIQLYDMEKDMGETINLHDKHPEVVADLTALLSKYIEDGRSTPGAKQSNDTQVDMWKENKNQSKTKKKNKKKKKRKNKNVMQVSV